MYNLCYVVFLVNKKAAISMLCLPLMSFCFVYPNMQNIHKTIKKPLKSHLQSLLLMFSSGHWKVTLIKISMTSTSYNFSTFKEQAWKDCMYAGTERSTNVHNIISTKQAYKKLCKLPIFWSMKWHVVID